MKNNFLGVKNFVQSHFTEFREVDSIEGGVYPPPWYAPIVAQITTYLWFVGIALMLAGDSIFNALGIPMPEMIREMNKNKPAMFMMLFVINSIGNSLYSTGAFEIYLNDRLLFSKLQTGRFPNAADLIGALERMGYKSIAT